MKASKKRDRDTDDLEDMRDAYRKHKEGRKNGSSENVWDKLGDGKNMRRILPREGERKFYTEGWTHFNVGPNDRAVRCIDEANIDDQRGLPKPGTRCPICKKFLREQSRINSEYAKGDEDGRAEWKRAKDKYVPRHQYYANVLRQSDDDDDFEVKILPFGTQVWSQLLNYYIGDDTRIGDFTDPEDGRWMNIKKEHKGGRDRRNIEYKVYPASESKDISGAWDAIKDALHDLDAAVGKLLSKDEVIAILKGVDLDNGSDDGDDGDDDDDADDRKSRRKRRDRDDEDDEGEDDDDDDDRDDDDDGDDEDDRPVRVKNSKLSKKMKRRRDDD